MGGKDASPRVAMDRGSTSDRLTAQDLTRLTTAEFKARYRVIGRLGSGAFADVVRLRPTAGGPDVALKVLRPGAPHPAGVPPEVALFREARALKHAGAHTNIVRLLGVLRIPHDAVRRVLREEAPGSTMLSPNGSRPPPRAPRKAWALLLEYACDGPAARLVAQQMASPHTRLYSDDDALAWAEGAAAALAHLHALSPAIIHRDVKLENLLLAPQPADGTAAGARAASVCKLSDLGLHVMLQRPDLPLTIVPPSGRRPAKLAFLPPREIIAAADSAATAKLAGLALNGATSPKPSAAPSTTGASAGAAAATVPPVLRPASALRTASGTLLTPGHQCTPRQPAPPCAAEVSHSAPLLGVTERRVAFAECAAIRLLPPRSESGSENDNDGATSDANDASMARDASCCDDDDDDDAQDDDEGGGIVPPESSTRLTTETLRRLSLEAAAAGGSGGQRVALLLEGDPAGTCSCGCGSKGLGACGGGGGGGSSSSYRRARVHINAVPPDAPAAASRRTAVKAAGEEDGSLNTDALAQANEQRDLLVSVAEPVCSIPSCRGPRSAAGSAPSASSTPRCRDGSSHHGGGGGGGGGLGGSPRGSEHTSAASLLWEDLVEEGCWCGGALCGGKAGQEGPDACAWAPLAYDLTQETGSCMYMAPEVFLGTPYNEAADVFSLGVVIYELISRSMLIFTHTAARGPHDSAAYAARVSRGYRPARPADFPSAAWRVVEACWAADPTARPPASWVAHELRALRAATALTAAGGGGGDGNARAGQACGCSIC